MFLIQQVSHLDYFKQKWEINFRKFMYKNKIPEMPWWRSKRAPNNGCCFPCFKWRI